MDDQPPVNSDAASPAPAPLQPPPAPSPMPPAPARHRKWLWAAAAVVLLLAAVGYAALRLKPPAKPTAVSGSGPQSSCTPSSTLVNPCRAWVGAAAAGNPGAPKDSVSQFTYLESLVGRQLDVFRGYHSYPGADSGTKDQPLNSAELNFAARTGTYLDINWNPSATWRQSLPVSQGGDQATNANIDAVARSIKSIAPHQIFLSLWHEANLAVDTPDPGQDCAPSANRAEGSPSQFNAAWRNVFQRFQSAGVSNVVWVMDYSSYASRTCWVKYLWPGNQYVDWVIYDTYSQGKTWDQTAGKFYQTLNSLSSASVDFNSKPWGIGEFGTCGNDSGISGPAYYQSTQAAVQANTYPKLKMYLVYADTGNNSGPGCLTDYDSNGQKDAAKQQAFNALFNAPAFK